ncbi:MAG TPA: helix-turn-helix transcriptional regulator [Anaerolineales bacterium]|nr:helix-turn-helix transcriptional regulator [Anaerolineales bacterium]
MKKEIQIIERDGKPYLSQIETGKRTGTTEVLSAIAKALDVSLEQVADTAKE